MDSYEKFKANLGGCCKVFQLCSYNFKNFAVEPKNILNITNNSKLGDLNDVFIGSHMPTTCRIGLWETISSDNKLFSNTLFLYSWDGSCSYVGA